MRVYLAGGAGAIGTRLVPQLVAGEHHVTATTRSAEKLDRLRSLGAEAVVVDGLDAVAVGETVARAAPDAIIHQIPLDPSPAKAQRESLAAIRFLEQTVVDAPLEGIVLRYGSFYGPGATELFVELVRKRKLPILGSGAGVTSWIHLDDAAAATVAALEHGRRGIYNVVDDEPAKVSDWLPYLAEVAGANPPLRIPAWIGRLAVGEAAVQWMTEGRGASNRKAKRELGWQPEWSSWREGFRHALTETPSQAVAA